MTEEGKGKLAVVHMVLSTGARVLLGVVFIAAAYHKILDPGEFALTVATYQVLPLNLINLQAIGLPWVELIVGMTLILGVWTRESSLITVGMNLMFVIALIIAINRGEELTCGCFTSAEAGHQIGWDLVIRDIGLMLIGLYLTWIGASWAALDSLIARRRKEAT